VSGDPGPRGCGGGPVLAAPGSRRSSTRASTSAGMTKERRGRDDERWGHRRAQCIAPFRSRRRQIGAINCALRPTTAAAPAGMMKGKSGRRAGVQLPSRREPQPSRSHLSPRHPGRRVSGDPGPRGRGGGPVLAAPGSRRSRWSAGMTNLSPRHPGRRVSGDPGPRGRGGWPVIAAPGSRLSRWSAGMTKEEKVGMRNRERRCRGALRFERVAPGSRLSSTPASTSAGMTNLSPSSSRTPRERRSGTEGPRGRPVLAAPGSRLSRWSAGMTREDRSG
jgi:hypothetical protein